MTRRNGTVLEREMMYPGQGFPPADRGGQEGPEHPWALLAKGRVLGKRAVVPFVAANSALAAQTPSVDILNIQGADDNAHQLCVTLAAPKILAGVLTGSLPAGTDMQGLSGEVDNIDICKTLNNAGGDVGLSAAGADPSFANPLAILQWGTGGVSHRAEIDFHNGLCVNVVASWLRLSAMIESGGLTTSSSPYVVAACIGPGTPKSNNAQRTMRVGVVSSAGDPSDVFTVPRFAKSVMLCGGNNAFDLYVAAIRFWRSAGGPADGFHVADYLFAGNAQNALPVPVPNGAYYFDIVSGIAGLFPTHNAVFDLAI